MTAASPWFLAAGAAAYVGGLAWFRWLLRMGPIAVRAGLAVACLATFGIGLAFTPEVQMGVLAAVLIVGILADDSVLSQTAPD